MKLEKQETREINEEQIKGKFITELIQKLEETPKNSADLEQAVLQVYDSFIHMEEKNNKIYQKFELEPMREIKNTSIRQLVEEIQMNLDEIDVETSNIVVDERAQLEELEKIYTRIISQLDGVGYSTEIAKGFSELENLNQQQTDKDIKRRLYYKVQEVLQSAKVEKYTEQREDIQEEKISFFGKLFGKEQLKEAKLKNLDLKIQLAQRNGTEEKEDYSMQEILKNIQECANQELEGRFTPEIQRLYDAIQTIYHNEKTEKVIENSNQINYQETAENGQANLPAIQEKQTRKMGKTKVQIKMVELENQGLQQQLLKLRTINSVRSNRTQSIGENNALDLLEQKLNGIVTNIKPKEE